MAQAVNPEFVVVCRRGKGVSGHRLGIDLLTAGMTHRNWAIFEKSRRRDPESKGEDLTLREEMAGAFAIDAQTRLVLES